jgi:hypothetical protein
MASPETKESLRLLQLAAQGRADYFLDGLLGIFSGELFGIGIPVGLLIGGTVVRGRLARSEEFAKELDETLLRLARSGVFQDPSGATTRQTQAVREALTQIFENKFFVDIVARRRRFERRVREALDKEWPADQDDEKSRNYSDLPADLASDAVLLHASPVAFALDQAEIYGAGGRWIHVGRMHVVLRQVDAWWIDVPDEVVKPEQGAGTEKTSAAGTR